MKLRYKRWFFVVSWLFAALSLAAQERPVLNTGIVQNFIENIDAMGQAFSGMADEKDFLGFSEQLDEFAEFLDDYVYYGEGNFTAFKTIFTQVKNSRASGVERVFAEFGLGQRGIEVYTVITMGTTIAYIESEFEEDESDSEEVKDIQSRLTMIRSLIHPDDLAVLNKYRETLLELFS